MNDGHQVGEVVIFVTSVDVNFDLSSSGLYMALFSKLCHTKFFCKVLVLEQQIKSNF